MVSSGNAKSFLWDKSVYAMQQTPTVFIELKVAPTPYHFGSGYKQQIITQAI